MIFVNCYLFFQVRKTFFIYLIIYQYDHSDYNSLKRGLEFVTDFLDPRKSRMSVNNYFYKTNKALAEVNSGINSYFLFFFFSLFIES